MHWDYVTNGFVKVCGHRGHSIGAPENTAAALTATRRLGGQSAEIDTVLTADGQIVVIHDLTVDRTTNGSGAVYQMTLAQVQALDAGHWFAPEFAGERIATLAEAIALAQVHDLHLEVEVKEHRDLATYARALAPLLEDPAARDRVMMISFNHVDMRWLKSQIPGIRTQGIIHARHGDPVQVARSAGLDSLSVELGMFHPDDALALHDAGIFIRCHAYKPTSIAAMQAMGINIRPALIDWLRAGLIDTLSGDDVAWLAQIVAEAGVAA